MTALFLLVLLTGASSDAQDALTEKALASYRLDAATFKQFLQASRLISQVIRNDDAFARDPLFTRDVMLLEDVEIAASQLERRLKADLRFGEALGKARLSARDYTKFALALFAARLAHGFMKSGALRRVPEGVARDNVAFVEANTVAIGEILRALGVE